MTNFDDIKTCNAQHTHTLPVYFQLFCKLLHTILLKITEFKVTIAEGNVGTSTILFFQEIRGLQQT